MPLCAPSTREGRKGGSGTQVSPAVAAPGLEELGGSPQPLGAPCRAWRSVWERRDAQGPPPCLTRFPSKLPGKIPGERAG